MISQELWYDEPAGLHWNRALPLGCGRLGAMIFGNIVTERIQCNEDSLWSGGPRDRNNPDAREALPDIERLLREGKLAEAHALVNDALAGRPDSMRCYEPLADVLIHFSHPHLATWLTPEDLAGVEGYIAPQFNPAAVSRYRRSLDLASGQCEVSYEIAGIRYTRQAIACGPRQVLACRFAADAPASISFRLRLERGPRESYSTRYADTCEPWGKDGLLLRGRTGGESGLGFAACLRVSCEGGTSRILGDTLIVENADAVTMVLAAATTFREAQSADYAATRAEEALSLGWDRLRAEQEKDHRKLFDRMALELGTAEETADLAKLPTDERLLRAHAGGDDPALTALYFAYGRYLLICSSRPGSLPATLQGVWNQDFWPSWGSKYTINVNLQMNYWIAEAANLAECHEPLFALLERMAESGRETARTMYGCRGFVAHHNTDLWADTAPTDRNLAASYWLLGGAWLALHLWEHYAFGGDAEFLQRAYPTLREATLFFLDRLAEDDQGRLVLFPTCSPENVYRLPNGEFGVLALGCSLDSQILTMLFRRTLAAAEILETDLAFRREIRQALARLPALSVGRHGQLMEWLEDYEEADPRHRHVAHAFALHPGDLISPRQTPELAEAVRVTLDRRGDDGTGWCMAWKACFWARLGDGERAHELLSNLLRPAEEDFSGPRDHSYLGGGSYPNLFCAHPPFQIDGNFGGAAAILEMLLQSHEAQGGLPVIHLLPALPAAWPEGTLRGLRTRGGYEIDLRWSAGELEEFTLRAGRAGSCLVRLGNESFSWTAKADEQLLGGRELFRKAPVPHEFSQPVSSGAGTK